MSAPMLEWSKLFLIVFVWGISYHNCDEVLDMSTEFPFISLEPTDFPLCVEETGYVEFNVPGCGCCGGCGCNVTCQNCGDPGGRYYPGAYEYGGENSEGSGRRRKSAGSGGLRSPSGPNFGKCCEKWPGDEDFIPSPPSSPASSGGRKTAHQGETCTPRRNCCPGKVRVTTRFIPIGCMSRIRENPSTRLYKVTDDFGLIRERGVIFHDGFTWRAVFKDRDDEFHSTTAMY